MATFDVRSHRDRKSDRSFDLICMSHLRWDYVYQRPQHLLSRFAREGRVFFFEEPVDGEGEPRLDLSQRESGVWVATPRLPQGLKDQAWRDAMRGLVDGLVAENEIREYVLWYYTPMSLGFTRHLSPLAVVYDCMDELSLFRGAPPVLREREAELFGWADLVFTGGASLYEAKQGQHPRVYLFPSSIDRQHFARARNDVPDPADQAAIPHPRLGFFGVIDERMDIDLVAAIARARPDWRLVIIGPVAKVNPDHLPRLDNIHYLGSKSYGDLPSYLAGWDVAILPFALNDSTRFISPTKTPEYLAGGKPVVSTPIRDVVRPYGERELVWIADSPETFVQAAEAAMSLNGSRAAWLQQVDNFLSGMSWDETWSRMRDLILNTIRSRAC